MTEHSTSLIHRLRLGPPLGTIALAALISGLGCNPTPFAVPDTSSDADPYYGFIDPSPLPGGFAPRTGSACARGKCYPAQQGYAHGRQVSFYNLFTYTVPTVPAATTGNSSPFSVSTLAETKTFDFQSSCEPGAPFDPLNDAFHRDAQYPIFAALPSTSNAYPFVARSEVTGLSGNHCNDLKTQASLAAGKFGAQIAPSPTDHRMWTVVDPTATFAALNGHAVQVRYGWFGGLQLAFLDGGVVPEDGDGNLVAMPGVLVSQAPGMTRTTDAKVIILSSLPGEAGYSPIVALHNFSLPMGKSLGDYTGICTGDPSTCAPNEVPINPQAPATTALFIHAL